MPETCGQPRDNSRNSGSKDILAVIERNPELLRSWNYTNGTMANWLTRLRWTAFTAWHLRRESALPFWPLDRVQALQSRRIRDIVGFAWREVPFYREAMAKARLLPGDIRTAEDLALLPLVSKEEFQADPARFTPIHRRLSGLAIQSTGTSGRSRRIDYDAAALFLSLVNGHRQRLGMSKIVGKGTGYREAVVARLDGVPYQIRTFYETHAWLPSRWELRRLMISPAETFPQMRAKLQEFRPDVVGGYGAHLGAYYRWVSRQSAGSHLPKAIIYGADRMADADRRLIEEQLGVAVFSFYQAAEALRIAFQCEERQGLHLSLDQIAVRAIDSMGRNVEPGESGEIVISNLVNRGTVLLNYRLGDVVTLGRGPCPCGRSLPTLERIDGRADDLLLLPDGSSIHALAVLNGLQAVPGVVQVQLVQEELRRFRLLIVSQERVEWTSAEASLRSSFAVSLGEVTLSIERVPAIVPDSSGKVQAVISRCQP
jgi:phenylacetate-CoA ligase